MSKMEKRNHSKFAKYEIGEKKTAQKSTGQKQHSGGVTVVAGGLADGWGEQSVAGVKHEEKKSLRE